MTRTETDYISRQAAIDLLCRALHYAYSEDYAVTQAFELPSTEPEQRWIPCSERLPESGVPVLISHVGFVTEDFLDIDELLGGEYFWNSGISLDEELNNLAWMPLPEPWKGEGDG